MTPKPKYTRLLIAIVVLALAAMACNLSGDGGGEPEAPAPDAAEAPTVEIRVPVNGMSFAEGTLVMVQAVGMDSGDGVSRIELQIDDLPVGEAQAPTATGQTAFMANFEWTAQGQGMHSVTAIAYRADGTASTPSTVTVNVVAAPTQEAAPAEDDPAADEPPAQEEEPTEEPAPEEPTEEPEPTEIPPTPTPDTPYGSTTAGVNVRQGPGTNYPTIGSLLAGTELDLIGRNADGTWVLVPYGLSQGWIYALYIDTSFDVGALPYVEPPPPPPTATPTPLPTATPIPVTPTPAEAIREYTCTARAEESYPPGTTIRIEWRMTQISAIYFNGEPEIGENFREVSPNSTTRYDLNVEYPDGHTETHTCIVNIE